MGVSSGVVVASEVNKIVTVPTKIVQKNKKSSQQNSPTKFQTKISNKSFKQKLKKKNSNINLKQKF